MKASKLVKKLQKIIGEKGDLEVVFFMETTPSIDKVEVLTNHPKQEPKIILINNELI